MAECYTINYTRLFVLLGVVIAYWNRRQLCTFCRALIVAQECGFRHTQWCQIKTIAMEFLATSAKWILRPYEDEEIEEGFEGVKPVQPLKSVPSSHRSSFTQTQALERKNDNTEELPRPSASFLAGVILGRSEGLYHPPPNYFPSTSHSHPMIRSIHRKKFHSPSSSPNISPSSSTTTMYLSQPKIPPPNPPTMYLSQPKIPPPNPPTMYHPQPPTSSMSTNSEIIFSQSKVPKINLLPSNSINTPPNNMNDVRRTRNGTVYNTLC